MRLGLRLHKKVRSVTGPTALCRIETSFPICLARLRLSLDVNLDSGVLALRVCQTNAVRNLQHRWNFR